LGCPGRLQLLDLGLQLGEPGLLAAVSEQRLRGLQADALDLGLEQLPKCPGDFGQSRVGLTRQMVFRG
jgi:hypothetical protein